MGIPLNGGKRRINEGKFMLKIGLWIIGLAMTSSVVAAPSEAVYTLDLGWKMSLDASGKITRLEPKPGRANKAVHKVLETVIRSWEFEPGSLNGKQVETDTTLWVSVSLSPTADGEKLAVTVDRVETGGDFGKMRMEIGFPQREAHLAQRKGVNPVVLLEVAYDGNGKPLELIVSDHSPVKDGALVNEAIRAIRTWTFDPERVAGHGVGGRSLIPICFVVNPSKRGNVAIDECKFPEDLGGSPFESGSSIALESRVTLKSDVIGKTL